MARTTGLRRAYHRKSPKPLSHSHTIASDNMAFWSQSANGVARMKRILIGLVAAIVIATGPAPPACGGHRFRRLSSTATDSQSSS